MSNVIGGLGDTDSLSVSFVPDTVGYFTYIPSVNPLRDLAVNIIIPVLQMRKQAHRLTCLGQGRMSNNSTLVFKPRSADSKTYFCLMYHTVSQTEEEVEEF